MLPRKANPIVLSAEYFSKSLSDLIVLEQQNPTTVTMAWLYAYCEINGLCLLPPSHFKPNSFFVITLMKGLRDFQEAFKWVTHFRLEVPKSEAQGCHLATFLAWNKKALDHNHFHARILQMHFELEEDLRLGRAKEVAEKRKMQEPITQKMIKHFGDISYLYLAELDLVLAEGLLHCYKAVSTSSPRFLKPQLNSKETFATLVDLSERVMHHLQNFEPNILSINENTKSMLLHCTFLNMSGNMEQKVYDLRKRLLAIQTETYEMNPTHSPNVSFIP